MPNIIIVGAGPAGVSAALYTVRSGVDTTVIHNGKGALGKTDMIENYYGFPEPISGAELEKRGIDGAKRLGVKFIEEEIVGLTFENRLTLITSANKYAADGIILATGTSRTAPSIKGLKEFEGSGVSYCAVCDAFFFRGKNVAVIGSGDYALHEALHLQPLAAGVTIFTDGKKFQADLPDGIKLDTRKLSEICGESKVSSVKFEDGEELPVDGIFIAIGTAGSTDLARKIGAACDNSKIKVDENMSTNIPGLFAAGDCVGGMLQVSAAVYEGAKAATGLIKYIRSSAV